MRLRSSPPSVVAIALLGGLVLLASPARADDRGATESAPSLRLREPRYLASPLLIDAHVAAGIEPHDAGIPTVFGAGGQLLWRGLVGPAVGLYASTGAKVLSPEGQAGLADHVSAALALAVRPLAFYSWRHGDSWLSRLLTGLSLEVGPALEYFRSSALTIPGCDIPDVTYRAGAHLGFALDVPLLGNAHSGWLGLHLGERLGITDGDVALAPTQAGAGQPCTPQIVQPAVSSQLFFGLSYLR